MLDSADSAVAHSTTPASVGNSAMAAGPLQIVIFELAALALVIACQVMSRHVTSRLVASCRVMPCHVM